MLKSIWLWLSLPTARLALCTDVIVVCAAVIAISLAFAVMPSPPITLRVLVEAIVPPPVIPVPAEIETPLWSMCSLATKSEKPSWNAPPDTATAVPPRVIASASKVPSTSTSPEISRLVASISPLALNITLSPPLTSKMI